MMMHVAAFPSAHFKDDDGNYTMMDLLWFRRLEDANKWLSNQPYKDGHLTFEVPVVPRGFYAIYKGTMNWWGSDLVEQAEDFCDLYKVKLIEFKTSWLE